MTGVLRLNEDVTLSTDAYWYYQGFATNNVMYVDMLTLANSEYPIWVRVGIRIFCFGWFEVYFYVSWQDQNTINQEMFICPKIHKSHYTKT